METFDTKLLEAAFGPDYKETAGYRRIEEQLRNGTPRYLVESDLEDAAKHRDRDPEPLQTHRNGW